MIFALAGCIFCEEPSTVAVGASTLAADSFWVEYQKALLAFKKDIRLRMHCLSLPGVKIGDVVRVERLGYAGGRKIDESESLDGLFREYVRNDAQTGRASILYFKGVDDLGVRRLLPFFEFSAVKDGLEMRRLDTGFYPSGGMPLDPAMVREISVSGVKVSTVFEGKPFEDPDASVEFAFLHSDAGFEYAILYRYTAADMLAGLNNLDRWTCVVRSGAKAVPTRQRVYGKGVLHLVLPPEATGFERILAPYVGRKSGEISKMQDELKAFSVVSDNKLSCSDLPGLKARLNEMRKKIPPLMAATKKELAKISPDSYKSFDDYWKATEQKQARLDMLERHLSEIDGGRIFDLIDGMADRIEHLSENILKALKDDGLEPDFAASMAKFLGDVSIEIYARGSEKLPVKTVRYKEKVRGKK